MSSNKSPREQQIPRYVGEVLGGSELGMTLKDHYDKYVMDRVRDSERDGFKYREFPLNIVSDDIINKLRELKYQVIETQDCVKVVFWNNINNQGFNQVFDQIRTKNVLPKFLKRFKHFQPN